VSTNEGSHADRIYAVTGAASGIGAATARWLGEHGARVIACDLHETEVIGDLATAEGRAALVEGVRRLCGGRLDGVVANAGGGPAATMLSLNFFGAVATLEGLRPLLAASSAPRAAIVSSISSIGATDPALVEACLALDEAAARTASEAAIAADRGLSLYASAKCALNRWCRRAAVTAPWAGEGILMNTVAPGVIDTPAAAWILESPEARAEMMRRTPLAAAWPGRPEQMAALLAWCVGPENALMTGQVLFADGGVECLARGDLSW
jgi:NAD(P)-dependent dehydrogenase (short-subunit alcohol dehydrogenase family)